MKIKDMTENEREQLRTLAACVDVGVARRARVVLMAAGGASSQSIVQSLGTSERTVRYFVKRFNDGGLEALSHTALPGRPRSVSDEQRESLAALIRRLPAEMGISSQGWSISDLIVVARNQGILCGVSYHTFRREVARVVDLEPDLRDRLLLPNQSRPGAPMGNRNAVKHGAYADDELSADERALVAEMEGRFQRDFTRSDENTVGHIRAAAQTCLLLNRALNAKSMEAVMRADRKFRKAVKALKAEKKPRGDRPQMTREEWMANVLKRCKNR